MNVDDHNACLKLLLQMGLEIHSGRKCIQHICYSVSGQKILSEISFHSTRRFHFGIQLVHFSFGTTITSHINTSLDHTEPQSLFRD